MDSIKLTERQIATRWVAWMMTLMWGMFFAAPTQAQTIGPLPGQLTFASTAVDATSAAQTVTVRNNGNATMAISRINITGNFAGSFRQTTTCGSTLARNRTCTVSVTFRPLSEGTLTAALNIFNNGTPSGVSVVNLSGFASPPLPVLSVSPTSVPFGNGGVNVTSGPRFVTILNTGAGTLDFTQPQAISAQSLGAGFAVANQCSASLTRGQSCVVGVTFRPTSTGAKTGTLRIFTNVSTAGFTVALTGTGTQPTPVLTLSPTRATLTCSNPYGGPVFFPINASNTGTANVTLGAIVYSGTGAQYFSETKVCPVPLTPGSACNIAVKYTPTGRTQRTATMTVNSDGGNRTVALTGSCRSHPSP